MVTLWEMYNLMIILTYESIEENKKVYNKLREFLELPSSYEGKSEAKLLRNQ